MAVLRGFFDTKTRAFVGFILPGGVANLQIDTGFNRQVLVGDLTAARLGVAPSSGFVMVQAAANTMPFRVQAARVHVTWLGQPRRIDVLVYENEQPRRRGEPDGLLGTGLIQPDRLLLDYLNDIVEISN